jgi:hypothetical protein
MKKKPKYCRRAGDILIDKCTRSGKRWRAAGGIFILHTNAADTMRLLKEAFESHAANPISHHISPGGIQRSKDTNVANSSISYGNDCSMPCSADGGIAENTKFEADNTNNGTPIKLDGALHEYRDTSGSLQLISTMISNDIPSLVASKCNERVANRKTVTFADHHNILYDCIEAAPKIGSTPTCEAKLSETIPSIKDAIIYSNTLDTRKATGSHSTVVSILRQQRPQSISILSRDKQELRHRANDEPLSSIHDTNTVAAEADDILEMFQDTVNALVLLLSATAVSGDHLLGSYSTFQQLFPTEYDKVALSCEFVADFLGWEQALLSAGYDESVWKC